MKAIAVREDRYKTEITQLEAARQTARDLFGTDDAEQLHEISEKLGTELSTKIQAAKELLHD